MSKINNCIEDIKAYINQPDLPKNISIKVSDIYSALPNYSKEEIDKSIISMHKSNMPHKKF